MAQHNITRIGPVSLAKIMGVAYAFLGLLIGGLFSLISMVGAMGAMGEDKSAGVLGMLFGVGAVIIAPILYGCLGFIGGLITGALYNLVAKVSGGLEIDLD